MEDLTQVRYVGFTSFSGLKCLNVHKIFYVFKSDRRQPYVIKATSPLGQRSTRYHNVSGEILDIIGQQLANQ